MNDLPSCSVIIRCLNEERHIGRLLCGILRQTLGEVQIIVVDSGSTDATVAIASRFPVEIVHIRPEDFSFGRSLNLGCRRSRGDCLVFASAHVYPVYEDWLEKLIRPLCGERVALAYGKQRGDGTTRYSERRLFEQWFPDDSNGDQGTPFCNNANAAIRREVWEQLPYDETLTGLEDIDWAQRAKTLGYRIAYVAEAEVIHLHDETLVQIYNRYRREAMALKRIFPHERFSFWHFLRLFAGNTLTDGRYALKQGELMRYLSDIINFRLMQFWGTYRGFREHGPVRAELRQRLYYPLTGGSPAGVSTVEKQSGSRIDYGELNLYEAECFVE